MTVMVHREYSALLRNDCDMQFSRNLKGAATDYEVHLAALPIEVYPVTSAMLRRCASATGTCSSI
jgi:hypothetical protein